jgi:hypothetical protein
VFYTPPGEAWLVQAYDVAKVASARTGGWNATAEETLGILMGYAEDENRYWREDCVQRGVFPDGMRLYCALTAEEARFVKDAAFRVLPWSTRATLAFHSCAPTSGSFSSIVGGCRDGAVVVRIIVPLLPLSVKRIKSVSIA